MIERFLRLFPQHRALKEELSRTESDAAELHRQVREREADCGHWRERCESAELRVRELTDRMLEDSRKVQDAMSLRAIGRRIHAKNPEPVEHPREPVQIGGRKLAREQAAVNTAKFFEELSGQIHSAPVA